MEIIKKQNIIIQWFFWHFLEAPKDILKIWKNFLKFNLYYFSIALLLKTLFFPWRRYQWTVSGRGFDIGKYLEAFFSNLISRILGAIVRSIFIIIGLLTEFFIFLAGMILFLGWLILPVFLIASLIFGFSILI